MAKGNMFLSQARGKVGSVVFSVLKGQQIERVYNPKPENPRSYSQQAQRALLANATKLYKRAISNFYKFAFEDKTRYESDYNAFAKANVMRGAYIPRDLYENPFFPALGDFVVSRGSLTVDLTPVFQGNQFGLYLPSGITQSATIGQISAALIGQNVGLSQGDIVTFVLGYSAVTVFGVVGNFVPSWTVVQFVLDPSDARPATQLGFTISEANTLTLTIDRKDVTGFGAVVFSRQTSEGLKVSDTQISPNAAYAVLTEWYRGSYARIAAARSWGATDEAILQGALALHVPTVTNITFGSTSYAPYVPVSPTQQNSEAAVIKIDGSNLKTTAQGGRYTLKLYSQQNFDDGMERTFVYEVPLTASGSSTSINAIMTAPISGPAGNYLYILAIDDEPVSYGSLVLTSV